MTILKCVACGHEHVSADRTETRGVSYTMCPVCRCGGYTKRKVKQ